MRARVSIVACLPPDLMSLLVGALSTATEIRAVAWADVRAAWAVSPGSVLVLDPRQANGAPLDLQWASHASAVFYTGFTPTAMQLVLSASVSIRNATLAIRTHDDAPDQLRALVTRAAAAGLGEQLAERIAPSLACMPEPVQAALLGALRNPLSYRSAEDIARTAGVSLRTLNDWTTRARVRSPKAFQIAGRVTWACAHLRSGTPAHAISARLGYSDPRFLSRRVHLLLGLSISDLRASDDTSLVVNLDSALRTHR